MPLWWSFAGLSEEDEEGYRNSARSGCAAITQIWLLLLQARWAFIKTRRTARAFEKGRVGERRAQAEGWVSRIMVRREGGGSGAES